MCDRKEGTEEIDFKSAPFGSDLSVVSFKTALPIIKYQTERLNERVYAINRQVMKNQPNFEFRSSVL